MITFRYSARTTAGDRVRGSLLAPDYAAAVSGLQARALHVTSVERERPWNRELSFPIRLHLGGSRDRTTFFRSFSTLIRAGVDIRRSLQVTIDRTGDERLRSTLRAVLADVERGDALSVAFGRRPRIFSPLIVTMINAGEAGGILDLVLERIAALLERDDRLRKNVIAALAYPATVLVASIALVAFLIVRIVPMFSELFAAFHADLPVSTRVLLWIGSAFGRPLPWLGAAGLVVLSAWALRALRKTKQGALLIDRMRLAVPFVGDLLRKTIHARFARMLSTLVLSGVELTRGLDVVTPITGSPVHRQALESVAIALREGEAMAPPLAAARIFDPMLVSLVGVGEETGMLDVMLEKAADYFEGDVAASIATLNAVIEPVLIVFLGSIVGLIVYSVYIPLYSLIGSISK